VYARLQWAGTAMSYLALCPTMAVKQSGDDGDRDEQKRVQALLMFAQVCKLTTNGNYLVMVIFIKLRKTVFFVFLVVPKEDNLHRRH
jgi:hypothetical protein